MPKRDTSYMTDRRDEIIDAALACLIRTGLRGLSTTAICEEAGISMGALYTHFASKDEVLVGLAQRAFERRREGFRFRSGAAMKRHFLESTAAVTTEKSKDTFCVDLELIVAGRRDAAIAKVLQPFQSDEDLVAAIKALQASGEIRKDVDAQTAATAIDALHAGTMVLALLGGRSSTAYRNAMALLLDSMLAR